MVLGVVDEMLSELLWELDDLGYHVDDVGFDLDDVGCDLGDVGCDLDDLVDYDYGCGHQLGHFLHDQLLTFR